MQDLKRRAVGSWAPRPRVAQNGVSSQLSGTLAGDLEEHPGGSWGHFSLPPSIGPLHPCGPRRGLSASREAEGGEAGLSRGGWFPWPGASGLLALMGSRDLGVEIPPPLLLHSCCSESSPLLPPILSPSSCFLCPVRVLPKPLVCSRARMRVGTHTRP